jgi:2-desacetyl-2-hydroxyethyl bacteriochlorophyllide A dehydrogenase
LGDARLCAQPRSIVGVVDRPGAFATRVRLSARQLVELPSRLSSRQAAAVVDAGATAVNAARVAKGADLQSAVVVGAGPLGALVCELLRRDGVDPVVVERNIRRRRFMAARGYAVAPDVAIPAPTPCVIDCSGAPGVPAEALGALQARGLLVVAGYAVAPELDFAPIARKELTIRGVRSGSIEDLAAILDLTATGAIATLPIQSWPLERINDAIAALRAGHVVGKAVIDIEEAT